MSLPFGVSCFNLLSCRPPCALFWSLLCALLLGTSLSSFSHSHVCVYVSVQTHIGVQLKAFEIRTSSIIQRLQTCFGDELIQYVSAMASFVACRPSRDLCLWPGSRTWLDISVFSLAAEILPAENFEPAFTE